MARGRRRPRVSRCGGVTVKLGERAGAWGNRGEQRWCREREGWTVFAWCSVGGSRIWDMLLQAQARGAGDFGSAGWGGARVGGERAAAVLQKRREDGCAPRTSTTGNLAVVDRIALARGAISRGAGAGIKPRVRQGFAKARQVGVGLRRGRQRWWRADGHSNRWALSGS